MYNSANTRTNTNSKATAKKRSCGKSSKWVKPFWIIYSCGVFSLILIFFLISMGWMGFMPSFADLENPETSQATEVYSEDGVVLGKYFFENRSNCTFDEITK